MNGDTSDLVDGFTYVGAEVTDVYPTFGVTTGGTSVTVTGTGFRYVSNVLCDTIAHSLKWCLICFVTWR